jgi:type IV secretory pathway VirB4 component
MYLILNYIWNRIRFDQRKRLLIIDEAWFMMQHEDSAKFVFSIAKRCRKYFLGLTVITQDVEDFLNSQYGRSVITNSSMQLLLKQSPASVDLLSEVFNLTDGEKLWLLEAGVGEGLFFAGLNHVAIKVVASFNEDRLITTNPQELLQMNEAESQNLLEANAGAAEAAFNESEAPVPGAPAKKEEVETTPASPPGPNAPSPPPPSPPSSAQSNPPVPQA